MSITISFKKYSIQSSAKHSATVWFGRGKEDVETLDCCDISYNGEMEKIIGNRMFFFELEDV